MQHPNVRVLVVDDQSPDGTGEVADGLARAHPGRLDVMHRTGQRGLGRSYIDGIAWGIQRARRRHLPDGRGSVARSASSAGADCRGRTRGRRDRLALCAWRRDRQLAGAPAAAQPPREHLHPADHAAERPRLHERLPLLAARRARRHAARPLHLRRLLVSGRDAVCRRRTGRRGSPKCRSRSSSGGWANRSCRARCCSSRRSRRGGWSREAVPRDNRPGSRHFRAIV